VCRAKLWLSKVEEVNMVLSLFLAGISFTPGG